MSSNVLNIGVNNWWKGYQMIIIEEVPSEIPASFLNMLFSRSQRLGVSLELCVFSGEDKQRLIELSHELGIDRSVRFLNWVSDVPRFFRLSLR